MAAVFPMAMAMPRAAYINQAAPTIRVASTPVTATTTVAIPTVDITDIPTVAASPKPVAMAASAVITIHQVMAASPSTVALPVTLINYPESPGKYTGRSRIVSATHGEDQRQCLLNEKFVVFSFLWEARPRGEGDLQLPKQFAARARLPQKAEDLKPGAWSLDL